MNDASRSQTATSLDALMKEFGWAVHDMQRLAHSVSLLASSLVPNDDFDAPTFYTDIDTLTDPRLGSPAGRKVAEALSDDDRRTLRALKACREDLAYRFFLAYRIDGDAAPDGAMDKVAEVRAQIGEGAQVLNRLFATISGG